MSPLKQKDRAGCGCGLLDPHLQYSTVAASHRSPVLRSVSVFQITVALVHRDEAGNEGQSGERKSYKKFMHLDGSPFAEGFLPLDTVRIAHPAPANHSTSAFFKEH
jgi:hypothetical protein